MGIVIAALSACRQGTPATPLVKTWSEEINRRYFADSFAYEHGLKYNPDDTIRNFLHFFRVRYPEIHTKYAADPLPYALEEEYIDTAKLDSTREWFRVIVYPFFRVPICFTMERRAGRTVLTAKVSDGRGRYFPGELMLVKRTTLRDSFLPNVLGRLDSVDFWHLGKDTCSGTDGDELHFEGMKNGRYYSVYQWSPDVCGNAASRVAFKIDQDLADSSNIGAYLEQAQEEAFGRLGIHRIRPVVRRPEARRN